MARQIIILETRPNTGGLTSISAALWFPIGSLAARVPRNPAISPVPNVTAAEQTDLESGAVLEEVMTVVYPSGMGTAGIKSDLVNRFSARAAYLATTPPTRQFFGVFYDGTAWSA